MKIKLIAGLAALAITTSVAGLPAGSGPVAAAPAEMHLAQATPAPAAPAASSSFSDAQKAEFGTLVRQYLLDNPEVIREAINALEQKRLAEEQTQRESVLADSREQLFNSEHQVVLGNPKGDVSIVEFFDYNCGYCRRGLADMQRLMEEDPGLRVVLKEFPILSDESVEAAQVALAVDAVAPEHYAAFHEQLLTGAPANGERAMAVAESLGVDGAALRKAIEDNVAAPALQEVHGLASALGLTGTPTYVIGDEVIVGAVGYDTLKDKVDAVRRCGSTTC